MELLKEAGVTVAKHCRDLGKNIAQASLDVLESWTDSDIGMELLIKPNAAGVVLSWGKQSKLHLSTSEFQNAQHRFQGRSSCFLAAVFAAKIRYETLHMITEGSCMDLRLHSATQSSLSSSLAVSAYLFSDPFGISKDNMFWGKFADVDCLFGGHPAFGSDKFDYNSFLARNGGSLAVLLPPDNLSSRKYVQRMVDLLDRAGTLSVPLSFAVFAHGDSLVSDPACVPSVNDVRGLDSRLGEVQSRYIQSFVVFEANEHYYASSDDDVGAELCRNNSAFFLLQNDSGMARYSFQPEDLVELKASMKTPGSINGVGRAIGRNGSSHSVLPLENSLEPSLSGYFDSLPPLSPAPHHMVPTDFGTIGGTPLSNAMSPSNEPMARGGRRGRLFDLVDDGDEEQLDGDIVSGMLNNIGIFNSGQTGSEVDIEAISLLGISSQVSAPVSPTDARRNNI